MWAKMRPRHGLAAIWRHRPFRQIVNGASGWRIGDFGDFMGAGLHRQRLGSLARHGALVVACLGLANCAQNSGKFSRAVDPKYGVSASERVVEYGESVPKGGGRYSVGKPYTIGGQVYTPEDNRSYSAEGLASWYGDDFHGRRTANGELFDMDGLTAAHTTLPMPSYVRVTNLNNRKSVIVRVNDRGPYHSNRLIDVSRKTAYLLGFQGNGIARVRVEYVGQAALSGSDDRLLEATLREGEPAPAPSAVRLASAPPFISQGASQGTQVAALRGSVPMPADRPYSLGEEYPVEQEPAATSQRSAQATYSQPPSWQVAVSQVNSAQANSAIVHQSEPVRAATLMPRSLGEQAQEMSSSDRVSGGFRSTLPPATSASAPTSYTPSGNRRVGGLY